MSARRHGQALPEVRRCRGSSPFDKRLRGLHAEVLEDRRLLSATSQTANDGILAALAGFATDLQAAPPSSTSPDAAGNVALPGQADMNPTASTMWALPQPEPLSFQLTALDAYVSAPDANFNFNVVRTFAGVGFDGYVLKLQSQEWRTADEVNRTLWEHWLIVAVPKQLQANATTALLAITGGSNSSATPPSNFSITELGTIAYLTRTVVAELRMVPNQPLAFSAAGEAAGTFYVPGESPEQVDLTFRFDQAPGTSQFSFGYYDVASVSADPVLAKRDYAVQAITNGKLLFDERLNFPGSTATVSLPAATELGFFIIPNDTAANFLADPDAYYGLGTKQAPLFSLPDANPGEFDQMTASIQAGVTRLAFEDLSRVGSPNNNGFDDVQISIGVELVPAPVAPGTDFVGLGRTEDEIIAYTFDRFLVTGDDTWPALLPMVKSAVRAMDAVQQFVPTVTGGKQIDDFVISGASKRGWTTWLTAAADAASEDPRVKAIIPVVFDALNLDEHLAHHKEYYEGVTNSIVDGYSNALQDYTELDVIERIDTPEGQELISIIDPYEYRDRLTMPKFMINSTGDEFFVPDSGQFYLGDLPGQNYVRYVPNTNHDVLDNSDAGESLFAYYNAIVYDLPLPQFSWTVEDDGTTIRVETTDTPLQVNVWQATNYDSRDFRRSVTGTSWYSSPLVDQGGGEYVAQMPVPNLGATAFFIELVYPGPLFNYKFTTQVSVLAAEQQTPVDPWLVPQLVDDVNTQGYSTDVTKLTDVNGTLFFTAYEPAYGRELWKSDGTVAGTVRVDIAPGPQSSYPRSLTSYHGALYFVAYVPASGYELWKSDGTPAGTMHVAISGPRPADANDLTVVDDTLFFTAFDNTRGRELWKSDGTAEGTMLVKDILPSSYGYPRSSNPSNLTDVNGTLFFTAYHDDYGVELWKSDGTEEGTMLVSDILPSSYGYPRSSNPSYLTEVNGTLFFTASDEEHGNELWKSDGTAEGTVVVADLRPGSPYGYPRSSGPRNLTDVNGTLYFTAAHDDYGRELWSSDGTEAGTTLVADISTGYHYGPSSSDPGNLTDVNGRLYFTAYDSQHARELWTTDGTAEGTVLVKDIQPGASYGNPPTYLTNVGGRLFFNANDGVRGYELWTSDGTTAGTLLVKDIRTDTFGSYPFSFTDVDGTLFFLVNNNATRRIELWTTDGTAAGAELLADYSLTSSIDELTSAGGMLFFSAYDEEHGRELWKSDGTVDGTMLVADILPGSPNGYPRSSNPGKLTEFDGMLFFTASDEEHGNELWKSDGTAEGTVLVADIRPGSPYGYARSSIPYNLTPVGGTLFFTAYDDEHGRELWKSDGTEAGTMFVADIRPGSRYDSPRSSNPYYLTNVGGTLFFTAYDDEHGTELWKSDGTEEGTMLVADIRPGGPFGYPYSSHPASLTDVKGILFFTASDNQYGRELWRSDGTPDGTLRVADINPFTGSYPTELTEVNGTLYFTAEHAEYGRELWKSDGTPEGTVPIKNIRPGRGSSSPSELTDVNGILFFLANDGQHGKELWQSDGTTGGTVMVADIQQGDSYSGPSQLTNVGGTLFFAALTQDTGNEPWLLVQPVEIDIRPSDVENNINPTSNGRISTAVLSSQSFDASTIDAATLTLAGAPAATHGNGTSKASLEDVNGDGLLDLVVQFVAREMQLTGSDTSALLEGKLVNGQRIRGSDAVNIVGPVGHDPGEHGNGKPKGDKPKNNGLANPDSQNLDTSSAVRVGALPLYLFAPTGSSIAADAWATKEAQPSNGEREARSTVAPNVSTTVNPSAADLAIVTLTKWADSWLIVPDTTGALDDDVNEEYLIGVLDAVWDKPDLGRSAQEIGRGKGKFK